MNTFYSRAEWLRHVRVAFTTLSQRDLAAALGRRHPTVAHWESGRNEVPDYVVESIRQSIPEAPEAPRGRKWSAKSPGEVVRFNPKPVPEAMPEAEAPWTLRRLIRNYPHESVPKGILYCWLIGAGL